ncbi:acetylxylan esterase A-like [Pecten maximus]|uniref:acetylxylan esterase A-like n=1 Tax=Pecten maximus TaxID=6579 RepID=UPI0014585D46|nr:acetylxylan esterase A-like [Pecten maximus]
MNTPPPGGEVLNFKYLAITSPAPDSAAACSSGETISLDTVTGGETCIASPNFPEFYPEATTTCRWRIETSDTIEYNVIFFHTEFNSACQFDFVKITVAGSTGTPQCGRQLQGVTQTGLASPVEVEFTFDNGGSVPGIFMCFKKIATSTTSTTTTTTTTTTPTTTTTTTTTPAPNDDDDVIGDVIVPLALFAVFVNLFGAIFF